MCTQEITREDIRVLNRYSKETLVKLPTEWQINNLQLDSPYDRVLRFYFLQGRLAIEGLATESEKLTIDRARSLYKLLEQTDQLLDAFGIVIEPATGKSCVGNCSDERDECLANCKEKFCGCYWDSFTCKLNCFFAIKIEKVPGQ